MKTIAFAFVALLVGANALPQEVSKAGVKKERFIYGIIIGIIESFVQQIQDLELDPLVIEWAERQYTFPVSGIFSGRAYVENFVLSGLGKIVISEVSFNDNSLSIDISHPSIESTLGDADFEVQILRRTLFGQVSGRLAIKGLRLGGQVTLGSGLLIDDLQLGFSLGSIESDLNISILGYDISERLNEYLCNTLPSQLNKYEKKINRVLAKFILKVLDRFFAKILNK